MPPKHGDGGSMDGPPPTCVCTATSTHISRATLPILRQTHPCTPGRLPSPCRLPPRSPPGAASLCSLCHAPSPQPDHGCQAFFLLSPIQKVRRAWFKTDSEPGEFQGQCGPASLHQPRTIWVAWTLTLLTPHLGSRSPPGSGNWTRSVRKSGLQNLSL